MCFTVEQRLEPVPLRDFSDHVKNMHKDRDLGFEDEYGVCYIYTRITEISAIVPLAKIFLYVLRSFW